MFGSCEKNAMQNNKQLKYGWCGRNFAYYSRCYFWLRNVQLFLFENLFYLEKLWHFLLWNLFFPVESIQFIRFHGIHCFPMANQVRSYDIWSRLMVSKSALMSGNKITDFSN